MAESMNDLDALIHACETGKFGAGLNTAAVFGDNPAAMDAVDAFHGSLDGAMALHKAILGDGNISTPGYHACIWMSGKASVWDVISGNATHTEVNARDLHDVSPARAWLLAILKAWRAAKQERAA